MAYFPMFVDLKNQPCIVIGGGIVAYRKIKALLEFEAKVTAVALRFCDSILQLEMLERKQKNYETTDIENAFLVIAATDDNILNERISRECRERKIPVNVVDKKEECSFIFPAYVKKGDITAGVTTSGKCPLISGKIKNKIDEVIPDYLEELVTYLGSIREDIKSTFEDEESRKRVISQLIELGCNKHGKIQDEDVKKIMEEEKIRFSLGGSCESDY